MEQDKPKPMNADANRYWYIAYQRRNFFKNLILNAFFSISSWPRLVVEVFLRKNMGERYFTPENAALVALVLIGLPVYIWGGYGSFWSVFGRVIKQNLTWYLFVAAFIYSSYLRWRDVRDLPSVFELRRFSLSSGVPFIFFLDRGFTMRRIATILEPAITLAVGIVLLSLGLPVGLLLIACGIIYSLSYFGAYSLGDDLIMDKMDEIICTTNLSASFKDGKDVRYTDGFDFVGPRPEDPEVRERVMDMFWDDEKSVSNIR